VRLVSAIGFCLANSYQFPEREFRRPQSRSLTRTALIGAAADSGLAALQLADLGWHQPVILVLQPEAQLP
jgi:hypothetical protein